MCLERILVPLLLCVVTASAMPSDLNCGVVPMMSWGGVSSHRVEYLDKRPVDIAIIEHTATGECTTDSQCEATVRSIQSYHMENLGWDDIGYSFLVGNNGKVYEGAGWLHVGAHTYGYNRKSIGIAFIGNFNEKLPSNAALKAVEDLLQCGVTRGHLSTNYKLYGHRQLVAIQSPGIILYNKIKTWPHWTSQK